MFPRVYTPADFDNCVALFLRIYSECSQPKPPREMLVAYLTKLIDHPDAHVFLYDFHDKPVALCCGLISSEQDATHSYVKRFYIEDFFAHGKPRKQFQIRKRLFSFANEVLLKNKIEFVADQRDFCQHRADTFRMLGFDPALNEEFLPSVRSADLYQFKLWVVNETEYSFTPVDWRLMSGKWQQTPSLIPIRRKSAIQTLSTISRDYGTGIKGLVKYKAGQDNTHFTLRWNIPFNNTSFSKKVTREFSRCGIYDIKIVHRATHSTHSITILYITVPTSLEKDIPSVISPESNRTSKNFDLV